MNFPNSHLAPGIDSLAHAHEQCKNDPEILLQDSLDKARQLPRAELLKPQPRTEGE